MKINPTNISFSKTRDTQTKRLHFFIVEFAHLVLVTEPCDCIRIVFQFSCSDICSYVK